MKTITTTFIAWLTLVSTAQAQQSCYKEVELPTPEAYSITFEKEYDLNPMGSRDNFYIQLQAGRAYGCVIFAVPQTKGKLKGTYQAVSAQRLNATCEGKQDYAFTQFVDSEGRRTFRLQCEYAVYEDQLPQPFAPNFQQAAQVRFNKSGERTVEVTQ